MCRKLFLLLLVVVAIYSMASVARSELLTNGDIEIGAGGWFGNSPYPSSWSGWGSNGSHHTDAGYKKDGMGVTYWWGDAGIYQDFVATAGQNYTISAELITPSADPISFWTGQVSVVWYDPNGNQIYFDIVGALLDTDPVDTWKTVSNTLTAPVETVFGRVVLMLGGAWVSDGGGGYLNSGRAYWDNISVVMLDPDFFKDRHIDFQDFGKCANQWREPSSSYDLSGNGDFDEEDLAVFCAGWLAEIPDYQLIWSDEFNGTALNLNNWEREVISGTQSGNWELQHNTDTVSNSRVEGGNLVIEAREEDYWSQAEGRMYHYTSARLRTKYKHDFLYGKIEARIQVPTGQGMWSAFWMLPTDWEYGGWPASGEIDIMETVNQTDFIQGALHYGGEGNRQSWSVTYTDGQTNFADDFHIYTIEWEPALMRWYVDGTQYWATPSWSSDGFPYPAPFDKLFHIILNVMVGGNWPGDPDESTIFPQQMLVDYLRVYKKNP